MKFILKMLFYVGITGLISACGDSASKSPQKGDFFVPSDSKALYFILERGGTKNEPIIVTKRVGSSGESYSKRIYNCSENTVKYLASSSTLNGMANSKPDPRMGPIIQNSIAYYVKLQACK